MDFEQARFNMVEQQIRPWEVLDPVILDLLFHVKRENFVGEDQRTLAFADIELPLPNGSSMLQPKQEARMVQDLSIQTSDKVLEIGTGSGYVTALLAKLAEHVFSVDIDTQLQEKAAQKLVNAGISNFTLINADGIYGVEKHSPFDVIFVSGSLPVVPESLKNQLSIGGRMIVTIGDSPAMTVRLIRRESQTAFSETKLYETCIERLKGYETIEPDRFVF